jgi:hypothetical protein
MFGPRCLLASAGAARAAGARAATARALVAARPSLARVSPSSAAAGGQGAAAAAAAPAAAAGVPTAAETHAKFMKVRARGAGQRRRGYADVAAALLCVWGAAARGAGARCARCDVILCLAAPTLACTSCGGGGGALGAHSRAHGAQLLSGGAWVYRPAWRRRARCVGAA